jgi:serine/threonine protein kinase/Tol biopolymer transport system component
MGEVYLARDSRLNRNVALKIISSESTNDETRRRRFTQEARSASALNHPNIVTIHDFGTVDGISYIVSELVDGESLRTLIRRGPLAMRELLDITIQIADGLAAAHEAGIVHRDLKPENIMITRAGLVKILDFGLAKPVVGSGTADELALEESTYDGYRTEPGLILGTVGYMSPEQARGGDVSFPSDQFSLGLILHEMATGQQAFQRDTPMQTLLAIANLERPPFTPGPVAFRLLVERCLAKEPEKRFAATSEIAARMRKIREELPSKPAPAAKKARTFRMPRIRRSTMLAALGAILAFAMGLVVARVLPRAMNRGRSDLSKLVFTPLASTSAIEVFPAVGPNGASVAYSAESEGVFQIFVRRVGAPLATKLTKSSEDCFFPFWSPDGSRLYFISNASLWTVSVSGGAAQLLTPNVVQASIAPDGRTLALIRAEGEGSASYSLWISENGAAPHRFERAPFDQKRFSAQSYPRFSPDGKQLAVWTSGWNGAAEFWIMPWPDGPARRGFEAHSPHPFAWMSDNRRIVYGDDHLRIADTRGDATQLTMGTGREQLPSVWPDGRRIAFSQVQFNYSIAELPTSAAPPPAEPAIVNSSEMAPAWSPARTEYAYVTDRSGSPEVWLRDRHSGWERPVVTAKDFPDPTAFILDVSFSPDGQRIAYRRGGKGLEAIWISTLGGEPPARLAPEPGNGFERGAAWSPDGAWLAYFSVRNGKYALLKARVGANAPPTLIKQDAGIYPAWSPKGDWIATLNPTGGLILTSPDGAATRRLSDGQWQAVTWSKHGNHLLGLRKTPGHHLAFTTLTLTEDSQVAASADRDLGPYPAAFSYTSALGADPVHGFSTSEDGQQSLWSFVRVKSDLWSLSGFDAVQ